MKALMKQEYPFNSYELLKSRTGKVYIRHNSRIQGDMNGKTIEMFPDEMLFIHPDSEGCLAFALVMAESNNRPVYARGKKVL